MNDKVGEFHTWKVNFRLNGLNNLPVKVSITMAVKSSPYLHLWFVGPLTYVTGTGGTLLQQWEPRSLLKYIKTMGTEIIVG
jgi:hypothetical protein